MKQVNHHNLRPRTYLTPSSNPFRYFTHYVAPRLFFYQKINDKRCIQLKRLPRVLSAKLTREHIQVYIHHGCIGLTAHLLEQGMSMGMAREWFIEVCEIDAQLRGFDHE